MMITINPPPLTIHLWSCSFTPAGAIVNLMPNMIILDPEDSATSMACAQLMNPALVMRPVEFIFIVSLMSAGMKLYTSLLHSSWICGMIFSYHSRDINSVCSHNTTWRASAGHLRSQGISSADSGPDLAWHLSSAGSLANLRCWRSLML